MGNTAGDTSAMEISAGPQSEFSSGLSTSEFAAPFTSDFATPVGAGNAANSLSSPRAASPTEGGSTTTDSAGAPKGILKNRVRFAPNPQVDEKNTTAITLHNTNLNRGRKVALDYSPGSTSAATLGQIHERYTPYEYI